MSTSWIVPRLRPLLIRGSPANISRLASSLASSPRSSSSNAPEIWDISASVCVERHPRVTPPLSDLQKAFLDALRQQEIENSLLNDHELAVEREVKASPSRDKGAKDRDTGLKTKLDLQDDWRKELDQFPAQPRNEDARGTPHEPALELTRPVVLLVREKRGSRGIWTLPTVTREDGETLRQTAERALLHNVGSKLQVQILGLAPWAVYNNRYSKAMQATYGKVGSKVR